MDRQKDKHMDKWMEWWTNEQTNKEQRVNTKGLMTNVDFLPFFIFYLLESKLLALLYMGVIVYPLSTKILWRNNCLTPIHQYIELGVNANAGLAQTPHGLMRG